MNNQKKHILLFAFFLALITPVFGQQEVMNHIIAAREYLKADNERLAKLEIDSALQISPMNSLANAMKGDLLVKREENLSALMSYDMAILADPDNAELYIKRAEVHTKLNNHRLYILNDYNKAISLAPGNIDYLLKKAQFLAQSIPTYSSKPDYAAAAATMSAAISIKKDDDKLYYLRSVYYLGSDQSLAALADINKAIALSTTNDIYMAKRGYINFIISRYSASRADYSRAINIDNTKADYFTFRGHANYNLENYSEAYDDYSKAIDLIFAEITEQNKRIANDDPLNIELREILLQRGMTLVQEGKPFDGCEDFERAYQMGEPKAKNYMRRYCY